MVLKNTYQSTSNSTTNMDGDSKYDTLNRKCQFVRYIAAIQETV